MKDLIQNIEQWAEARNIINGSIVQKQIFKLAEEVGELFSGHKQKQSRHHQRQRWGLRGSAS